MPCYEEFKKSESCGHERHQIYLSAFHTLSIYNFVEFITKFVLDPNISSDNEDDTDLFQDFVFSDRLGRLHIYYYEHLFFDVPGDNNYIAEAFCRYLDFLGQISPFFTQEALNKPFKMGNISLIESIMIFGSHNIKLGIIKTSDKYPHITKRIPKLKLYNLFS